MHVASAISPRGRGIRGREGEEEGEGISVVGMEMRVDMMGIEFRVEIDNIMI